jgi:SAM-dependent methyltransferase
MSKYKVINDPEYGFLRVEPVPTQQEVEKFYADEFYSANAVYFNNSALSLQLEQKGFFDSRWESIYNIANNFFEGNIANKSVFDIGFGFAQALLYLKTKGLVVSGLEPSKEGVDYALSHGVEAYHVGIEDFDCVGSQTFEMVLLLNVLEHLRNPVDTLQNIKTQLLKSNGLLVIDVPNDFNDFQVIANEEYNLNEWWVYPPNHINYFSPTSLKKLLADCGYEVVHCESSFPLDMFLMFGDVYVGNSTLGRECHNKRVQFEALMRKHNKHEKLSKLYQALADLDLGRTFTIYATPKG